MIGGDGITETFNAIMALSERIEEIAAHCGMEPRDNSIEQAFETIMLDGVPTPTVSSQYQNVLGPQPLKRPVVEGTQTVVCDGGLQPMATDPNTMQWQCEQEERVRASQDAFAGGENAGRVDIKKPRSAMEEGALTTIDFLRSSY